MFMEIIDASVDTSTQNWTTTLLIGHTAWTQVQNLNVLTRNTYH